MRVLIINKFLYPNGGSETYIFKLGEALEQHGHEVQYFGMEHEGRCVGNRVNAYTSDMDFHGGSKLSKLTYPIKTIYSKEAREKLRLVLDDFKPDVCHLNNFNYQLTPSIILEIVKWRKETGRDCKIIFTAHDYQLVCPNHQLKNPITHENCEKCLGGHFMNCVKGKCVHGSTAKSAIGMMEAEFWKWKGTYKYIDTMICCSEFMKSKMDSNPLFATKTVAMNNFIDKVEWKETEKKDYVLYFGRFSEEKGIGTLIKVCKELPDVQFDTWQDEDGETHMTLGFSVYGIKKTPLSVLKEAWNSTLYYGRIVFTSLADLLRGRESINNLSGPVGIVSAIGQAASYGWQDLLELLALITVNLGILNLLPFPALDGGKVVFLVIEGVTGHAVPEKLQSLLTLATFGLLFGLMLFATYNDIIRLVTGAM